MPDGPEPLPDSDAFRSLREGLVLAPAVTRVTNFPPMPLPIAYRPLLLPSCAPFLCPPPTQDDPLPPHDDNPLHLPQEGLDALPALPTPSPAVQFPLHASASAPSFMRAIADSMDRLPPSPIIAAAHSLPPAVPPGSLYTPPQLPHTCDYGRLRRLARIRCRAHVATVLCPVSTAPQSLLAAPPLAPDDKIFRSPRGGLTSAPIATPLRTVPAPRPPPWPDITKTATLPMPVVPTGAPDSALGAILDAIASMCTSFRHRVRWRPRVFQVF
jgi:hypothetical protein